MDNLNYNPFSLVGKTILVTGASSGIGRATAIECSKMGATVIISALPEEYASLQNVIEDLTGDDNIIAPTDLRNEEEIHSLATALPQLDGIVYSAGTLSIKPISYYSQKNIMEAFSVNTFSCMSLTRALITLNKLEENCSLVFISSIASNWSPVNSLGLYSASKAALDFFSKQCASELSNKRIRSNTINPGIIETNMINNIASMAFSSPEKIANSFKDLNLCHRLGKPEEVAWMAVYLLSDASSFVTGSNFIIDGGFNITR